MRPQLLRWSKKLREDLEKFLHYPLSLVDLPVTVRFPDGETKRWSPPVRIEIHPSFYQDVHCKLCGKCCRGFSRFWSKREMEALGRSYPEESKLLKGGLEVLDLQIEQTGCTPHLVNVYVLQRDQTCRFWDKVRGCMIRDLRPIHCHMPMIKFKNQDGVLMVTKEPFGRAHMLGCTASFHSVTQEGFQRDLESLSHVMFLANDLGLYDRSHTLIKKAKSGFNLGVTSSDILSL